MVFNNAGRLSNVQFKLNNTVLGPGFNERRSFDSLKYAFEALL
jgi:hypothetical protein